jgi:hypothetical protein
MSITNPRLEGLAITVVAATFLIAVVGSVIAASADESVKLVPLQVSASSEHVDFPASAAADGDRFSRQRGKLWKGMPSATEWQWMADFGKTVSIGSILQIVGDEESFDAAAPLTYVWQVSEDGTTWRDLKSTQMKGDRRLYRIHRLSEPVRAKALRLLITGTAGAPPSVREIEVYAEQNAVIPFPDWFFVVNSQNHETVGACSQFYDLVRKCEGWSNATSQFVWHGYFDKEIALAEPRPVCALFTGSTKDWCEVDRHTWVGVENVLNDGQLPIWAACGGGQALGILSDAGAGVPWDCPKCRDLKNPKLPIYGHIGLIDESKVVSCGDYSNNIYEIGPTPVKLVGDDPVFKELPKEFLVPEYHCGQLEYVPKGWDLLITNGSGGKTAIQCIKKRDTCIYAVQFHIEIQGTPETSLQIMSNFLARAKEWSREHNHDHATANGTDKTSIARTE